MMEKNTHSIADRFISIKQPHVRPIVTRQSWSNVEFGTKVAISLVGGDAWVETMQWDSFNEATTLKASVEFYKERFGFYPAVILADKIYRNRNNLSLCKELGNRLSEPKLGRPSTKVSSENKKQELLNATERNAVIR